MPLKLYFHPLSQPSRALLHFLKKSKVAFEPVVVDLLTGEHKKDAFTKLNPEQFVPVLTDGDDIVLTESVAEMSYVANTRDVGSWLPRGTGSNEDAVARARVDYWLNRYHTLVRPIRFSFYHRCWSPLVNAVPENVDVHLAIADALHVQAASRVEQGMTGKFLCGDEPTVADLLWFNEFIQLEAFGLLDPKVRAEFPKTNEWLNRVAALPDMEDELSVLKATGQAYQNKQGPWAPKDQ